MQSEIENIKKGVVVKTPDYNENKRIIGIVQSTVQSVDGSIPPLSKQTAFKTMDGVGTQDVIDKTSIPSLENVANNTFVPQPQSIESNQIEQPFSYNANSSEMSQPLPVDSTPEPLENIEKSIPIMESQLENPVQMNNPSVLESLVEDVTNIGKQVTNNISNTLETVGSSPESLDNFNENIELPKIVEPAIAEEPTELNASLFDTSNLSEPNFNNNLDKEKKPDVVEQEVNNTQQESNVFATDSDVNNILKAIDARKMEISDKIAKYMTAASNMLVEEIIEIVKAEMNVNAVKNVQEPTNIDNISNVNVQNELNPFTLNL